MCTNVANEVYDELCVEEVFKCYEIGWWKEIKECQSLSVGMPHYTHKKYSSRLKHLSLGMPPLHPLLHQQLSGLSPSAIFLLLHMLCAELGASILVSIALIVVHNKWDPTILLWERDTLHFFLEYSMLSIQFLFLATALLVSSCFSCLSCLELISFLSKSSSLLHV